MNTQTTYRFSILTGKYFFSDVGEEFHVNYGSDDAFQGTKLGVNTERKKHEKEENRPEWSAGELINGFRERDES